jgi:hypothetical protein
LRALVIVAAILLTAPGGTAGASEECAAAFAQWVKLSEQRIRRPNGAAGAGTVPSAPAAGACIPGEAARRELLQGLARTRGICAASAATDHATQHTKVMIGINESFIAALAFCRSEAAAPAAKTPPKPAETVRRTPRPRACLEISRVAADRHVVANRRCRGTRVLGVIETRAASGVTACKAYTIEERATLSTPGEAPPTLNYECPLDTETCTRERIAAMFPECDW